MPFFKRQLLSFFAHVIIYSISTAPTINHTGVDAPAFDLNVGIGARAKYQVQTLKGLNQAKISKDSVILFWLLYMTIIMM